MIINKDLGEFVENRIVSGNIQEDELATDKNLRPQKLSEYIGQDKIKSNLEISIAAALKRGDPLDHSLIFGPPGVGKTTLANILALEMNAQLKTTSGPAIEKAGDLVSILTGLKEGDVLFIDEIHRLPRIVEEILYPAMEDLFVTWMIDKGMRARSMNLSIKPFCLIGATTRFGMVSSPLRDRFGSVIRLDFYDYNAMILIVERSAKILGISGNTKGFIEIAKRSRGTPRIANRLLRRVRDYAQVKGDNRINETLAKTALNKLEVDELGLDDWDVLILKSLIEKFGGGPVGLETLAASISEDVGTITEVYEPYLLQVGMLDRTRSGRVATARAYNHLGYELPSTKGTQHNLL